MQRIKRINNLEPQVLTTDEVFDCLKKIVLENRENPLVYNPDSKCFEKQSLIDLVSIVKDEKNNSTSKNRWVITRRFRLKMEDIINTFKLSESEVTLLTTNSDFFEQFSRLKLSMIFKDMVPSMKLNFPEAADFDFKVSPIYYESKRESYTIDFNIYIPICEIFNNSQMTRLGILISNLLRYVETKFYQTLSD